MCAVLDTVCILTRRTLLQGKALAGREGEDTEDGAWHSQLFKRQRLHRCGVCVWCVGACACGVRVRVVGVRVVGMRVVGVRVVDVLMEGRGGWEAKPISLHETSDSAPAVLVTNAFLNSRGRTQAPNAHSRSTRVYLLAVLFHSSQGGSCSSLGADSNVVGKCDGGCHPKLSV